jgi:hypothetical protein
MDMNVHSLLFTREKEKTKSTFAKYCGVQISLLGLITPFFSGKVDAQRALFPLEELVISIF